MSLANSDTTIVCPVTSTGVPARLAGQLPADPGLHSSFSLAPIAGSGWLGGNSRQSQTT